MLRFPKDFLTLREQNALLLVCAFAIGGMFLNQLGGEISQSPASAEQVDSLSALVSVDKPVLIDIRIATKEELMELPGIGEKRAQDIIAYRTAQPFTGIKDLLEIKGIGTKTLAKMLPMLIPFGSTDLPELPSLEAESGKVVASASQSSGTSKSSTSKASRAAAVPKSELTSIINLNTAGLEELCTLSGIGEVKAQAIIDYRTQNGAFASIEDITKVKGIGAKTLEKIRKRLSI